MDAASMQITCFDKHELRLLGDATIETIRQEPISCANRGGHEPMPACNYWLLEVLLFCGDSARGIHITQDPIFGLEEVRMWIESRVEEGNDDASPSEVRVRMDTHRGRQEPPLIPRIDRKWREQFVLKGSHTTRLDGSFHGVLNTLQASTILRLPIRMILVQNSSYVVFDFRMDGEQNLVERLMTDWAQRCMVQKNFVSKL